MNKNHIWRIFLDFFIVFIVFLGWWPIALLLSIISLIIFPFFYEIIIFGIIFDSLFGFNKDLGLWACAGTFTSSSIYLIFKWAKKIFRD